MPVQKRYTPVLTALVFAAMLALGGAAWAGSSGSPDRPDCSPLQAGNLLGGAQVCPVVVDPDIAVDPVVTLPVVVDLQ